MAKPKTFNESKGGSRRGEKVKVIAVPLNEALFNELVEASKKEYRSLGGQVTHYISAGLKASATDHGDY